MMNYNYAIFCVILSTFGSYLGTYAIRQALEKSKRNSFIIFTLAAVLGLSTISIPLHTLVDILNKLSEGIEIWDFKSPC